MQYMREVTKQARMVFDEYDKDKNGALSVSELRPLLNRIANLLHLPKPSDKDIEEGIIRLDRNKNGFLEYREFLTFFIEVYGDIKDL